MRHSYGILLYRYTDEGKLQVFLGHASSPRYWTRNPKKIWGIPKGRAGRNEKPLETAKREFQEEVGIPAPDLKYKKLCKYATPHKHRRKRITIFIGDATGLDIAYGGSQEHTRHWPSKKKGAKVTYLEMDDAQWFTKKKALKRALWGQRGALRLFFKTMEAKAKKKSQPQLAFV